AARAAALRGGPNALAAVSVRTKRHHAQRAVAEGERLVEARAVEPIEASAVDQEIDGVLLGLRELRRRVDAHHGPVDASLLDARARGEGEEIFVRTLAR